MTRNLLGVLAGGAVIAVVGLAVAARADDDQTPRPIKGGGNKDYVNPLQDPELKKKYPFESIAARLEYEKKRAAAEELTLTDETKARLKQAEGTAAMNYYASERRRALLSVHNLEVKEFTDREGFGMIRLRAPTLASLNLPPAGSIAFAPAPAREPNVGPGVTLPKIMAAKADPASPLLPGLDRLERFHNQGVISFVNFTRIGLVKDRENVAGFNSHQFAYMPGLDVQPRESNVERSEKWKVRRLELMSLLKHEKPAVYLSDSLPRMEELKSARTRELTDFEAKALKALHAGEDLQVDANLNQIRMVGSMRATSTCLKCHDVKRGDLLGAFSYLLQRDPPANVVEK